MSLFVFIIAFLLAPFTSAKEETTPTVFLRAQNTVIMDTDVTFGSPDLVFSAVVIRRSMTPPKQPIYIVIDSYGGYTDAGRLMIRMLSTVPNVSLICLDCQSMAAGLFEGLPGFPRLIVKKSHLMAHQEALPVTADCTLADFEKLRLTSRSFNAIFWSRMGIPEAEYQKRVEGRKQINLYGESIIKAKLADTLVNVTCDDYISAITRGLCQ